MIKIGIVTIAIEKTYNYGNKLQTYALQAFLRENGYYPELIRYRSSYLNDTKKYNNDKKWKRLFEQSLQQTIDDSIRVIKRRIFRSSLRRLVEEKEKKFDHFLKDNIVSTDVYYSAASDLSNLQNTYDCFIAGSDQVWNPYWEGAESFYYLDFAPVGKRIAYAPSIAVPDIPDYLHDAMKKWISGIDFLSVREVSGKNLIAESFGLDAKVVCDPVFLLSQEKWEQVAIDPEQKVPYFAVYILGKKTIEIKQKIHQLEKNFHLKAIDIYAIDDPFAEFPGIGEFLGWIKNSEFVLTDSFHGTAFSLIFEKPIVTLERDFGYVTSSRIDSLLKFAGINYRTVEHILNNSENLDIDCYADTTKWNSFVNESKQYLLNAIKQSLRALNNVTEET